VVSQDSVSKGDLAARERPVLAALAMNTYMWDQRITAAHVATLRGRGVRVIEPVVKMLACGDKGKGAMASVASITEAIFTHLRDAGFQLAETKTNT
jgi:phosphopantothenoylcysteine synthetase/decarboxylase